ncbi:tetraspanin-31-B-like [Trichomycterus rosablanca]|uniref:tetraspanin-31-B-like n=1 Tax=Trichomycterus rosablanca TaxID=2290929 RepID=UPI002F355AE8
MLKFGFLNTKNALCAANVVYLMMGVSLMAAAIYGKSFGIVSSLRIISGAMAIGFLLILASIMGIIGTLRQNQIVLFVYILVLLLVFIFQFTVSCSCLALRREKQEELLSESWALMSDVSRRTLEQQLDCCGLLNSLEKYQEFRMDVNMCTAVCKGTGYCFTCGDLMLQRAAETLKFLGGVGLFCSFSQLVTVWLAVRYRNMKNPQITNTSASS